LELPFPAVFVVGAAVLGRAVGLGGFAGGSGMFPAELRVLGGIGWRDGELSPTLINVIM